MNAPLFHALARPASQVVFYGTSLTASGGWVEILAAELASRSPGIKVTNAACDGQNSRWGLEQFDDRVLARAPDVFVVEFAINDAVARFNISPAVARGNLEAMLDRLAAQRPDCVAVLQVMNPVIDRPPGHDGHRPNLPAYEQIYRETAKARGLVLVDHAPAWAALLARGEAAFRHYVPDGLHPGPAGYAGFMLPTLRGTLGLPESRSL
jgi:lysophospholipase L1-like esterase